MDYSRSISTSIGLAALLALSTVSITACTKKEESSRLRVVLPMAPTTAATNANAKALAKAARKVSSSSSSGGESHWNSAINPAVGSDINCFAVFVGGGTLAGSSCGISDGSTINFGPHVGFLKAGEEIWIDTPPGDRTIYVIGLTAATAAACSNFANSEPDGANLSEPFLIATHTSKIPSGPSTLTISAALNTGKIVENCNFMNPTGGGMTYPFGDDRDGSISAMTSFAYLDGNSDNLGVSGVDHFANLLPSTKIFNATRRVTAVASSGADAGKLLGLGSSVTADEFEVGDEVVWYVAGGTSSFGSPDDNVLGACGGGLYLGRYGTSRIADVPASNQLLLESAISSTPAAIKNTNLAAAPSTSDYCTLVVSRISSFESIDVPSGMSLQLSPAPFSYADGTGGVMAIRADMITVDGTLIFYGSGAGFAGGAAGSPGYQGEGLTGLGSSVFNSNYNGGGGGNSSSIAGGGGSNGGIGGNGATNTGSGGTQVAHCSGVCTPFQYKSAFMGGGGGGAMAAGGRGGGLVLVFAKSISGSGTVFLKADGASGGGGSVSGGSGAGGTVGLFAQEVSVNALNVQANGGNAVSVGGGAGGGGVVEVKRCAASSSTTINTSITGGALNGGGTAGGAGFALVTDDPMLCSIN